MLKQKFNDSWLFTLNKKKWWEKKESEQKEEISLPHDYSIFQERKLDSLMNGLGGYFQGGDGSYKKIFFIHEKYKGKRFYLEFDGVYMNADVSLNGETLGNHIYGYTAFYYDMTPYIKIGQENCVKVEVHNNALPNSRWYSGSGIYRDVHLLVTGQIHIENWGVFVTTPRVSREKASVCIEVEIENHLDDAKSTICRNTIIDSAHHSIASDVSDIRLEKGKTLFTRDLVVEDPQLWSVETPYLYQLKTEIINELNEVLDTRVTTFGIRSIAFDAKRGFLLNGDPMKIKGGCVHHDNGLLGAASYKRSEYRKVELLKEAGYNAVRCAHNPPSCTFLQACDEIGMLVMDESFDSWIYAKTNYDYHKSFAQHWKEDLQSMVKRDRNHPSIIMWSIGNEVGERFGNNNGYKLAKQLADYIREMDSTRAITSAVNGGENWPLADGFFNSLDVCGYNYLYQIYEDDIKRCPERIILGTESFPNKVYENWKVIMKHNQIIGDFNWTAIDYLGEAGLGRAYKKSDGENEAFIGKYPWHMANCGDFDICGFKRPQSYYRDIVWGVRKAPYVVVHQTETNRDEMDLTPWGWDMVYPKWDYQKENIGKPLSVDVYTADKTVSLYLNGRLIDKKDADCKIAHFIVEYEEGELRAVTDSGEFSLHTPDVATEICLSADNLSISKDQGLCYVTVEIKDNKGRLVTNCDKTVYISVKDAGCIKAIGNGDPLSEEMYVGNFRRVYHGKLMVVILAEEAGDIILCAQADGIREATLHIKAVETE